MEPGPDWPGEGVVAFNDVCMRYKDTLPLVLHNFREASMYNVHLYFGIIIISSSTISPQMKGIFDNPSL